MAWHIKGAVRYGFRPHTDSALTSVSMFALRSILPLVVGLSTVYGASSPAYQSPSPSPAKSGSVTSYKPSPSPSSDSYKPSQASSSAGPVSSSVGGNYPFPPGNWLGFGLDLTTINPSDITTVSLHLLALRTVTYGTCVNSLGHSKRLENQPHNHPRFEDHRCSDPELHVFSAQQL